MNKITVGSVVVLGCLLFSFGCATLQQLAKKPEITYEGLTIRDMTVSGSTLVFHLNVSNPNPVGARISDFTYKLKVNNKALLNGVLDKGLALSANGTARVDLPMVVNYFKVFDSVSAFMSAKDIRWDLSGTFHVMGIPFPYHAQGELPLPKIPKISLSKIEVSAFSFSGAALALRLDVENDNTFTINPGGLDYSIKIGGMQLASGRTSGISSISGKSKATLRLPVEISFKDLGLSVYSLLKNDSTDYELSGRWILNVPPLGEKAIPFSTAGQVRLQR